MVPMDSSSERLQWPANSNTRSDTSEDRIERTNAVEEDWTPAEEAALLRKLDLRVLLPCCVVYFVAYVFLPQSHHAQR